MKRALLVAGTSSDAGKSMIAHVLVRRPADCHQARRELEQLLCERFGLGHTTLQVDHAPDDLLTIGDGAGW